MTRADIGVRHAHILGLPAGISAGQVGVAEQAGGGVAEYEVAEPFVAVGALADGEIAAPALLAFAADDGEGDDDAVATFSFLLSLPTSTTSPMNSWPMMSPDRMPGMKPS